MAQTLIQEAQLYRRIMEEERFYAHYFRVVYHGEGFDEEIREKEFVYRGVRLEPVMDFTNRIKKKFPDAQVQMSSDKPNEKQRQTSNKIISITTLQKPNYEERLKLMSEWVHDENKNREKYVRELELRDPRLEAKEGKMSQGAIATAQAERSMPVFVRKHRDNNDMQVFSYSVPVQKGAKGAKNEFKDLWVNKSYIFTKDPYPNNRRRIEVIDRKETMLAPVENAVATITEKNADLKDKVHAVRGAPLDAAVDLNPLTMALNGIIDAAVNGGARMYVEAFLHDDFLKENPTMEAQQKSLIRALREQQNICKEGMEVFGKRCGDSLQGLFEHLKKSFGLMQDKTKDVLF